jgi:methylmalonyl-CoA mutase cobalamin-binding domain/chain
MPKDDILRELAQAVIDGEPEDAAELAQKALEQGMDPLECINEGLTPGMNRVGELFESGEYYLPDLIIGGEAMKEALAVLEPALVEGDLHEIGKTLVGTLLTANGFLVTDIGIDKSAAEFVEAVKTAQADIVGASALLTTTMPQQEKIIEALKEAGLRDQVKVMVGGAPVTAGWAEKVGADGYAEDAIGAVSLAKQLAAQSS